MSAGAVDDRRIALTDQMNLPSIGQDNAQVANVINVGVDVGAAFGGARGQLYSNDAKGPAVAAPDVHAQVQVKPQDPQDPWANTGQDKKPVMDGIQAAEHNFDTTARNMQKGACYAMEMGEQTMKLGGELIAGIGSLLKPSEPEVAPQMALNRFAPQPPQMNGPTGGLFT